MIPRYPARAALLSCAVLLSTCGEGALAENASIDTLKQEFRSRVTKLEEHSDGFFIDNSREAPDLLAEHWASVMKLAAAYLNASPKVSGEALTKQMNALSKDFTSETLLLDKDTALVAVAKEEIGTVFILHRAGKQFEPVWSITDGANTPRPDHEALKAWFPKQSNDSCRVDTTNTKGFTPRGPLFATIGKLPDDADGHHRFYVLGTYSQPAGATVGGQLSVWRWTGDRAEPVFLKTFIYMAEVPPVRMNGSTLLLRTKEDFKTFYSCGSCPEREIEWRIEVTPHEVVDHGKQSLNPELDAVDEILDGLLHSRSVSDLAALPVIKALTPAVNEAQKDAAEEKDPSPTLGMLFRDKATRSKGRHILCMESDGTGPLEFTFEPRGNMLYATSVRKVRGESCD